MSAYVVTTDTIDLILTAHSALSSPESAALHSIARDADLEGRDAAAKEIRAQLDLDGKLTKLGKLLLRENVRSVNARYDEGGRAPRYKFSAMPVDDLVAALPRVHGAIRCLNYQSCEHEGWQKSAAHKWLAAFQAEIELQIPLVRDPYGKPGDKKPKSDGWDAHGRYELTAARRDKIAAEERATNDAYSRAWTD